MKRRNFLRALPCRSQVLAFMGLLLATALWGDQHAGQTRAPTQASPSSRSKKSPSSVLSSDLFRFAYAIGSITKTFTAAAVLTLAAEGKISLDDTVASFVPSFPEPGRSATIRQLLGHTSGIRSMTSLGPKYWAQAGREIELIFAGAPSDFPPGTLADGTKTSYGQGLGIDTLAGKRRLFHGGGLPGFDAFALAVPDEDLTISVLCNTDGDAAMEVADAMAGLLLGR